MFLPELVWLIQNQTGRYILKILLRWKSKRAHERRCVVMRDAPSLCVKKEVGNFERALKKFPTCNKSPPNTQKIDCESFFFGFPIYFYFSAFVPPMQPSIFFFDGCLAKNGFSACFS